MREDLVSDRGRVVAYIERFDDSDGRLLTTYWVPGAKPGLLWEVLGRWTDFCTAEFGGLPAGLEWPEDTRKVLTKIFDGCPEAVHECVVVVDVAS